MESIQIQILEAEIEVESWQSYIVFCTFIIAILRLSLTIYEAKTNRQSYLLKLKEMEEGRAQDL